MLPQQRTGFALGFGTGFLAAMIVVLVSAGLIFGMFSTRSLFLFAPGVLIFGFGRRGFLHGLLISLALTLVLNAIVWGVARLVH